MENLEVSEENAQLTTQVQELAIERNELRDELDALRNSQTTRLESSNATSEVIVMELKEELD